jgi:hypothetical protein
MPCIHKPYDESVREDRRDVVASAIASQRLEGLELDAETLADFDGFVSGQMDLAEVKAKIEARFTGQASSMTFDM